jgi:hypothetical protein
MLTAVVVQVVLLAVAQVRLEHLRLVVVVVVVQTLLLAVLVALVQHLVVVVVVVVVRTATTTVEMVQLVEMHKLRFGYSDEMA